MADTRAAISRRVCSESARRAISVRERSSSSMSRALAIATAAWSASADRSAGVGLVEGVRAVAVDGDRADDHVAVDERRGDDRADPDLAHERVALGRVDEPFVVEVVAGPLDPAGARSSGPTRRRRGRARPRSGVDMFEDARMPDLATRPGLGHAGVAEQVDHRPGRPEQPDRRVDDGLEDLVLVVRRADPAGDLAQRPLGVGGPGELPARARELLDQPGVGDRDGGLAGERPDQAAVGRR